MEEPAWEERDRLLFPASVKEDIPAFIASVSITITAISFFFYFRKDSDIVHTTVETALKAIRNKMLPFQDRVEPSIRYPESGNLLSGRVRYPVLP